MSGYLQRLASNALEPGGVIHPVLGSVFSAPRDADVPESLHKEEDIEADGHLQRLASAPKNSRGTVHPVMGSIFTPPEDGMSDSLARVEDIFSGPPSEPRLNPSSGPSPVLQAPNAALGSLVSPSLASQTPMLIPETLGRNPNPDEKLSSKPLLVDSTATIDEHSEAPVIRQKSEPTPGTPSAPIPRRGTPTLFHNEAEQNDDYRPNAEERILTSSLKRAQRHDNAQSDVPLFRMDNDTKQRKDKEPAESPGQVREKVEVSKRDYRPLMAENVRPAAVPSAVRDRAIVPSNLKKEKLPQREPDEIQIHIGRIEVLAVPPAPARPAAKAANKSESLDEYLKRRDGRAT